MFGLSPAVCIIALVIFVIGMVCGIYFASTKSNVPTHPLDGVSYLQKDVTYRDDGSVEQVTYKPRE
jgi:hypothetical protein